MALWHFGNTSVRSAPRLKEGLEALAASPVVGALRGSRDNEIAFNQLLGEKGVVTLQGDDTYSVGRKWRSALCKMGFLYDDYSKEEGVTQEQIGSVDTITPNGLRLIQADTVPAIQECYLRGFAAYFIEVDHGLFSPLKHVLAIMQEIEARTGESKLSFMEMAIIVQTTTTFDNLAAVVDRLLDFRARRTASSPRMKVFDRQEKAAAAGLFNRAASTFGDYADTNFRYLRSSGLVLSGRRSISFNPLRRELIRQLIRTVTVPATPLERFKELTNGARLPTDDAANAQTVLQDLIATATQRGLAIPPPSGEAVADLNIRRFAIEELLSNDTEQSYANDQVNQWQEIAGYMELLWRGRDRMTVQDEDIAIPRLEKPAYFEWVLWRAFLAINELENRSFEARRFRVDQDFLPMNTAPGGGPDSIFVFQDFVIAGEVTLTTNTRQEAAEGEPVRRHVAKLVDDYPGKHVYGLFIANTIDSNTAETFRHGKWYRNDDTMLNLDIIPMTLREFHAFFVKLFNRDRRRTPLVRELLDYCNTGRDVNDAPEWKAFISTSVHQKISKLQ